VFSRNRTTVVGLTLLLCLCCGTASATNREALALKDQYGQTGGLAAGGAGLQVAIVVSAKRLRRIKPWEQAIRRIDTDVPVIRVADVPRTAPTEYDAVAEKLRKRLPEDLNVLIDLDGVWMKTFDLDTSVPNVLIFNGSGELLARHAGMYRKDDFDALEGDLTGPDGHAVADTAGGAEPDGAAGPESRKGIQSP
jgi:hypothetical protein